MTRCMFLEEGARCDMEASIAIWSSTYHRLLYFCLFHVGYIFALWQCKKAKRGGRL